MTNPRKSSVRSHLLGLLTIALGLNLQQCGVFVSVRDVGDSAGEDNSIRDSHSWDIPALQDGSLEFDASEFDSRADRVEIGMLADDGIGDTERAVLVDARACEVPDSSAPPDVNRSCRGASGAPAEHCREVWHCGGSYIMGSVTAWKRAYFNEPWARQTQCDLSLGEVHAGFIDAYPVSVARFREFMRAGQPQPRVGEVVFDSVQWTDAIRNQASYVHSRPSICSYRDAIGENDSLPMNCMNGATALAFCYWDGKHVATEAAWEFVATNGGRSLRPFQAPANFDPCLYGDVDRSRCRPGANQLPLPIDAFPQGQTRDPLGVYGMWGGGAVAVLPARALGCRVRFVDGWVQNVRGWTRGFGSGFEADYDHMQYSASVDSPSIGGPDSVIRCMRWIPESR